MQRSIQRLARLAAASALVVVASAMARPAGESAFHCQRCYNFGSEEEAHQFSSIECDASEMMCMDCHSFNACHSNIQSGSCWGNHSYCGATLSEDVQALRVAVSERDAERVELLLHERPATLVYNRERGLIQFRACRGALVGQVAVPHEIVAVLD
jgi:hypothetical protein